VHGRPEENVSMRCGCPARRAGEEDSFLLDYCAEYVFEYANYYVMVKKRRHMQARL